MLNEFKTQPMIHQLAELEVSRDLPARALFWSMGTGKTWLVINTAARLFHREEIDGMLVVTPSGVQDVWLLDEIPRHLPDDVPRRLLAYRTRSALTAWHRGECAALQEATGALTVLAMSYDALVTKEGRRTAEAFLRRRRCILVLDESHRIKTPGAQRTRIATQLAALAPYRRILTGTPSPNSPFDLYSQLRFLQRDFWVPYGFASAEAFRTYFGIMEPRSFGRGRFMQVVGYRHLDQLQKIVGRIASRIAKEDVLDLPPKTYQRRYFDLGDEQRRVYDDLRREFEAWLDSGERVEAPLAITRLVRLQQVSSGFLPLEGIDVPSKKFNPNPRLTTLRDLLEDVEGQALIFARFTRDIDAICEALGDLAVRYDGATDEAGRLDARRRFQAGEVRYLVGNPAVAGLGIDLTAASTVIYYSNSFNLAHRLQSEDRAHRIGQTRPVTVIDLVARDTIDVKIVDALLQKYDLMSQVTGDALRRWYYGQEAQSLQEQKS